MSLLMVHPESSNQAAATIHPANVILLRMRRIYDSTADIFAG